MTAEKAWAEDSSAHSYAACTAGAERLSMPPPPPEVFLEAVVSTVRANRGYVPPLGKGSLYIRPLLLGTGPILGLGPAPSYTLVVYAAAVGAYFKVGPILSTMSGH